MKIDVVVTMARSTGVLSVVLIFSEKRGLALEQARDLHSLESIVLRHFIDFGVVPVAAKKRYDSE